MKEMITRFFQAQLTRLQREQMRGELLSLSDQTLADAGFSRELLLEGIHAWPWRIPQGENLEPLDLSAIQGCWVRMMGKRGEAQARLVA